MVRGNQLRMAGILIYVILTFIDRFCFHIPHYVYIPIAIIGIIMIIIGFMMNKNNRI